jgi:hypothetical protein
MVILGRFEAFLTHYELQVDPGAPTGRQYRQIKAIRHVLANSELGLNLLDQH